MRAVNLIPLDQRGRRGGTGGIGGQIVVGVLAVLVLAIASLVFTANSVNSRKDEVAQLQQREAKARAELGSLSDFARFEQVRSERVATIKGIVKSRFDWDTALRELAKAVPSNVDLTDLKAMPAPSGTAAPPAGPATGGNSAITGPSLEISGCASGHTAVAGFIRRAERMKGVTRVGVPDSTRALDGGGAQATQSGSSSGGGCGKSKDTTFKMTLAYDGQAPAPPVSAAPAGAAQPGAAAGASSQGTAAGASPATTTGAGK